MDPLEIHSTEAALRDAVLAGSDAAWHVLYERAYDGLYAHVAARVPRGPIRAEDVVQDTWLIAVRKIGDFDPARGCFESWLKGIADRVLANARRKSRPASDGDVPEPADGGVSADRQAATSEALALSMAAIPDQFQHVLKSKYDQRLTVDEIALRDGRTPKAIESLLGRARRAFQAAYRRITGDSEP